MANFKRIKDGWSGALKSVINGGSTDVVKLRKSKCLGCIYLTEIVGVCSICNCPYISKTEAMDESCPKNKWEDIQYSQMSGKYNPYDLAIRIDNSNSIKGSIMLLENKTFCIKTYENISEFDIYIINNNISSKISVFLSDFNGVMITDDGKEISNKLFYISKNSNYKLSIKILDNNIEKLGFKINDINVYLTK